MNPKVSIIKCDNYEYPLVLEAIRKAIDLIGGIAGFIKPASRVLVKPNLLMAKEPANGITTHPAIVRAVVRMLKEIDCKIYLGDGPSVWGDQIENIDEVFDRTGMRSIAKEEDIELVKFDKRRWRGKFPLTTWLDHCDCFISIPKFKTHNLTVLTAGIKNLYGLVSGTFKTELHKNYYDDNGFAKILVDIYELAKPNLTIVDGVMAMEGEGPGTAGKLRKAGLIVAGSDCVAIDSILALVMGLKPQDIPTIKEGAARGLGVMDMDTIQILGEKLRDIIGEPFALPLPARSLKKKIPRPIIELAKKFIRYYPRIDYAKCSCCGACVKVCPAKTIKIKSGKTIINYSGCICCFCCEEICPSAAIKVKKSVLARMIGL